MSEAPPPARRPWWIPPFLGPIPEGIRPEHLRILGFVAFAMLFENYDIGLLSAALPQIASEFGLDDVEKGSFLGSIELGGLAAFVIVPLADVLGRRRLLLACVVGMSLGSLLTAFAPNAASFAIFQILTRSFATTATVVSFVIVAEEFPAAHRGWGIGMLVAVGSVGFGIGALVYSQSAYLPYDWRSIYALGGLGLVLLPVFRRNIRETRRFEAHVQRVTASHFSPAGAVRPVLDLLRRFPMRAALLGAAALLSTAGHRPAFRFVSDFLQTQHDWSRGEYALMTVVGGTVGILGGPFAGRLGDRLGRRQIGAAMLALFPFLTWVFYAGPAATLVPPWIAMVFVAMASGAILRSLGTELFPTDMRSSAGGWVLLMEILGAGLGLFLYAALEARLGSWGISLTLVSIGAAVGGVFLMFLPDTHGRELETISSDLPLGAD